MTQKFYPDPDQQIHCAQMADQLRDSHQQEHYQTAQNGDKNKATFQAIKGGLLHRIFALQRGIIVEIAREDTHIKIVYTKPEWTDKIAIFAIIAIMLFLALGTAIGAFAKAPLVVLGLGVIAICAIALTAGFGNYRQHQLENKIMQLIELSVPRSESDNVVEGSIQSAENSSSKVQPSTNKGQFLDWIRDVAILLMALVFGLWLFWAFQLFNQGAAPQAMTAVLALLSIMLVGLYRAITKQ